jgi:tol-pal system-associated acyl-CoA thioesterase
MHNESFFSIPVRVYYEDTDAGGVVYYANYLRFLERARTEWLSAHAIELAELERAEQTLFVVTRVEADYKIGARLGERLTVTVEPLKYAAASMLLLQRIFHGERLIFEARVTIATIDAQSWKPKRFSKTVRDKLPPIESASND